MRAIRHRTRATPARAATGAEGSEAASTWLGRPTFVLPRTHAASTYMIPTPRAHEVARSPSAARASSVVGFETLRMPHANSADRLDTLPARLEEAAARGDGLDTLVARAFAEIRAVSQPHRIAMFVVRDGAAFARWVDDPHAGRARAASDEELSRSVVRQAIRSGRRESIDAFDGGAAGSAADLGIVAALAVPSGDPVSMVVYVDFRDPARLAGLARLGALEAVVARLAEVEETKAPELPAEPPVPQRVPPLESLLAAPGLREVADEARRALAGSGHVLVLGETGSGKTVLASAFAERLGLRPVVRVMLGASDDLNTIASELFGHERGAFSGATSRRTGTVEHADGGVLVLDEVLNLPAAAQQLLLDFAQFGTYRPLGYDAREPRRARVRLLAVTNGDLHRAVREGRFREDLYYRLAGHVLHLPPLRARRADIPALAETLLERRGYDGRVLLTLDARRALASEAFDWPGNLRELESTLTRAAMRALTRGESPARIEPEDLAPLARGETAERRGPSEPDGVSVEAGASLCSRWEALQTLRGQIEGKEEALIAEALERHRGVVAHAARELGIARTTLASRLGKSGSAP